MSKEICISSTPHETRLAIIENDELAEIYYERENEYTLAGSIYKGRVTRVLPGMQSAFVDLGLERDAFLYVTDFLEEQEDSADFDRTAGAPRREGVRENKPESEGTRENRSREPRENRDTREARAPREQREKRPAIQPDQVTQEASVVTPSPSEGRDEESDQGGTRRWRGRRGRRRGVRPGREGEPSNIQPETREPVEPVSIEAASEPVAFMAAETRQDSRQDTRQDSRQDSRSEPRTESRSDQRRPSYSSKSTDQPIFLPGESLSKYGHAPAAEPEIEIESLPSNPIEAVAATPAYTAFKPSTMVETPIVWDGGSLLPGETISRYRKDVPLAPIEGATRVEAAPAKDSGPAPTFAQETRAGDHQARRTHSREAVVEKAIEAEAEAAVEETTAITGHAAEPTVEAVAETHQDQQHEVKPDPGHQDVGQHEEQQAEPVADGHVEANYPNADRDPEPPAATDPSAHQNAFSSSTESVGEAETGEEVEPQSASASYRVDHAAPSEFRLVTPVFEESQTISNTDERVAPVEATTGEESAEVAKVEKHVDRPHVDRVLGKKETVGASPELDHSLVATRESVHASEAGAASMPVTHATQEEIERAEATAEKEELLNKEQVLGSLQDAAEDFDETDEESGDSVGSIQGFAPGSGVLEEEVIEEEEYDYAPLHAHHDENDLDELEEETIDHNLTGADLGEMVRDTHIDKRTNVAFNSDVATEDTELEEEEEDEEEESGNGSAGEDGFEDEAEEEAPRTEGSPAPSRHTDDGRRGGRGARHGRRRSNNGGGGGDRGRRATSQLSDMPVISDLLKQGQEILVQIAKEPIAKKGARITSHIALPGRFLVFMPTVNHVGVSRKISSDEERSRLKRILISEKGDSTGGFIVRTAADGAGEEDLRADIRFLISLWTEIKQRAETGKAPALIYHDLNLVERILRDQVSDNFSSIWVDSEVEYERIVRFLNRFQPSLVRRVKFYTKETPLFEQFGINEEISKALKSKVWLKSGGSIVINQTEALVAIDVNTGKYVGKTARLEDTIVKTNLDAIPEIVRQIRLRDLGGIIVIDFIDMDERKNRNHVLQALEEALKADRAPSKVLQFNDFGLVAITRKRVKQSLERTLSVQCSICQGTGMVKGPATVCNEIYVEMRKMLKSFDHGDVLLRVHPEVVKTLKEHNAHWLTELEEMIGKNIIVKSDPSLHPEQFDIH